MLWQLLLKAEENGADILNYAEVKFLNIIIKKYKKLFYPIKSREEYTKRALKI